MDLTQFDNIINNSDVVMSYSGAISEDVIDHIIGMTEEGFMLRNEAKKVRKKVINLLIESVQNIYHYMEKNDDAKYTNAHVMVTRDNESYKILTQNHLKIQKAQSLKKRIDNINVMSKEDVNELYINVLKSSNHQFGSSSAGLGLIDMVRRSGQKIQYDFTPYEDDNEYMVFTMQLNILHNQ